MTRAQSLAWQGVVMQSGLCLVAITLGLVWFGNAPTVPKVDVRAHACETALAQARERERALTPRRVAALLDLRYERNNFYLGYHLRAEDLREAMQAVLEAGAEVVILRIEGGQGRMGEAEAVMRLLEEYELVCDIIVWVSGVLCGAPGIAVAGVDEMCFTSDGMLGPLWYFPNALVNYAEPPDRTKVAPLVLEAARLSGRSEAVYRSLGAILPISYDIHEVTGAVQPRQDRDGQHQLHHEGRLFQMVQDSACVLGFSPCGIESYEEMLEHYGLDDTGLGQELTERFRATCKARDANLEMFGESCNEFFGIQQRCELSGRLPTPHELEVLDSCLRAAERLLHVIDSPEPMGVSAEGIYSDMVKYRDRVRKKMEPSTER